MLYIYLNIIYKMKDNLKNYEKRIAKLKHRLKYLHKDINTFKELTKKIKRLNKIIKGKSNREKSFKI